jgi:sugar lactone lactonase YvrE
MPDAEGTQHRHTDNHMERIMNDILKYIHGLRASGLTCFALASTLLTAGLTGCSDSGSAKTISIGTIATVAGTGKFGYSGDGGLATAAQLNQPTCAVSDSAGNLYIGDVATYTVRKVAAATGIITPYAGNGKAAYSGDGGPATVASIYGPAACALDSAGNLYIADVGNNVVRKITASTGIITTVAGNGVGAGTATGGFSGDGGLATQAELEIPNGVAVDSVGNLFISDMGNQRVREVDAASGIITTIAGNGTYGYSGNGGAATSAMMGNPQQLALDGSGNLYIAEQGESVVVKVNLSSGIITTVAGDGTTGRDSGTANPTIVGDGGIATKAKLAQPQGVALDADGNIFIADSNNGRVRKVTVSTGIITSVVGSKFGYSGDGGPSNRARLHNPEGLFFDAAGNLYIADSYNSVVRKVTP